MIAGEMKRTSMRMRMPSTWFSFADLIIIIIISFIIIIKIMT